MFYKYVIFICLIYVLIYYNTIQSIHVLIHYNHTSRKIFFFSNWSIYFSILACVIPWTEEPGRLQSMGSPEADRTE